VKKVLEQEGYEGDAASVVDRSNGSSDMKMKHWSVEVWKV
jgi:hypothetical protein